MKKNNRVRISIAVLCLGTCCTIFSLANATASSAGSDTGKTVDWPMYGGQAANDHYSGLDQINRQNVSKLRIAWKFDTGEKGALQTSPLVIGQVLYA